MRKSKEMISLLTATLALAASLVPAAPMVLAASLVGEAFTARAVGRPVPVGTQGEIVAVPPVVARYIDAVNAGDAEAALEAFADDGAMYLTGGRVARGRAELDPIERFHAAVRPKLAPAGLEARRDGDRVIVAMRENVERSAMFEAMGLPQVRTASVSDAFVVVGDRIVSARQPEFVTGCQAVIAGAFGDTLRWLESRNDPRATTLMRDGRLRIDADTAPVWIGALREWRQESGGVPAAGRGTCAR